MKTGTRLTKQTSGQFTVNTHTVMLRTFPVLGHHLNSRIQSHSRTNTHNLIPDLMWKKNESAFKDKSAQIGANTSATMAL